MVAATYGNYEFKGFNKALETVEKTAPVEARMEAIADGTNIIALIKGRHVAVPPECVIALSSSSS